MRSRVLINIDVADLERAVAFYGVAFGLSTARQLGEVAVEMTGAEAAIYLLAKPAGGSAATGTGQPRDYARHWTPVHLDFVVDDLEAACARAERAGAAREGDMRSHDWGRIAGFADPFGHGFCLIEFSEAGYDAIAAPHQTANKRRMP